MILMNSNDYDMKMIAIIVIYINSYCSFYNNILLQVAILRLLQQLGQVYSVMKIDSLKALVPFANFGEVEQIIVEAVKNDFIKVCNSLSTYQVMMCKN